MGKYKKIGLELEHDDQVLKITLSAPKGNVLDKAMILELNDAIRQAGGQPNVKAIIFQGEGQHFSFGASVPEHQKEYAAEMLSAFHSLMRTLIEVSKPMFALVRGQCLGGGLELAAFCHWIFAAEDALLGQPEIKLAVFPPVASLILPYRIGQSAADDLILTGRAISAKEAQVLGLIRSVSTQPEEDLDAFLVEHILPKSAVALQFTVESSRLGFHRAFLRSIDEIEKIYVHELMATEDANEGIHAFMEKRKPVWKDA